MKRKTNQLGEYAAKFKGFTREEESEQFILYFRDHDEKVKQNIYNHSLRIIFILITYKHMYDIHADDLDDLIMILAHHLWELIPKYKIEKGNRFSTFAQFCLYNKAKSYLKKMRKHNERFISVDIETMESIDAKGTIDIEKEGIVREFGEKNGYQSDVTENAVALLSNDQKSPPKTVTAGYEGRYKAYGNEVMRFHFSTTDEEETYNLLN